MIVAGSASPLLLASAAGGYNLTNSLRFRQSASANLTRTPSSSGNRQTWTWSAWVKRGRLSNNSRQHMFSGGSANASVEVTFFEFTEGDNLRIGSWNGSSITFSLVSSAVYRDVSSWYHIVLAFDTTQATSSNRIKIYVNGVEVTSFSTSSYPSLNLSTAGINATAQQALGKEANNTISYFDGYMAEINFIDGQALTPSSFGQTDSKTGVWQPKKYAGSYGTNGFYLPFTDNSSLTTSSNVGLGKDFSGNGNYWTTNNISITSGATYDSMTDVPTLTSATQANFATLNPLSSTFATTFSNANLNILFTDGGNSSTAGSTIAVSSGKWYAEMTVTATASGSRTYPLFGISNPKTFGNDFLGDTADEYSYSCDGFKTNNGTATSVGTTFTTNDVMMMAFDATSGNLWWGKNGTWIASGNPSTGSNPMYSSIPSSTYIMAICGFNNASAAINFGQRPFAYTPPTGFVALNTFNLPTPTIGATASTQANKYMDISLWTGNGSTQSITNTGGFAPDFVWIKSRSGAYSHQLYDVIRGATNALYSNDTTSTGVELNGLTAFNSNGFSVGNAVGVNASGASIVGWQWDAGGTGVTNTAGSITSTVSANTSSGFSIVTYTGTGSNATVGHGLGVAPNFIIIKSRNAASNWIVGGSNIAQAGNGTWSSVLEGLNTTNAINTGATSAFNSTAPTSTVFTLGTEANTNGSGRTFVAYCFAAVAGYSAFGSYTGNGSADGTFVYTGFRPRYVMLKRSSTSGNDWNVMDTARDTSNVAIRRLYPNRFLAEESVNGNIDILSNGFKIRNTDDGYNASGSIYIYACFAETPFKYANAR